MGDLATMYHADILDKALFWRLLGRSMTQWCDLYQMLDFRINAHDVSAVSQNEQEWHAEAANALADILHHYQVAADVAQQMNLPGPGEHVYPVGP